ncbi:MAG: mechanosensitive ion channel family protein [Halanaerobiaceae bacterium]
MQWVLFNNTVLDYIQTLVILSAGVILIKYVLPVVISGIVKIIGKRITISDNEFSKTVSRKLVPLFYVFLVRGSLTSLTLSRQLERYIGIVLNVLLLILITLLIQGVIIYFVKRYWDTTDKTPDQRKVLHLSLFFLKIFIWILAFVFLLDNLDVKLTGLLTGLGVGGIAIGFAAQSVLTDIFSYFTIFFDRPFDIGDFIIVGDYKGTIEHIGLKTTRVRSLGGEEVIISNTDLLNSRINNYKRMERRRINFSFGVTYETDKEQLEKIPGIVEDIINDIEGAEFDRAHFGSFENFNLLFQVVYYVKSADYKVYMDIQEKINLRLKEELKKWGIQFAYPTQTVYVKDNTVNREERMEEN